MSAFLQQVFTLLTTEAGSLTYHLVLAFAIAGAIPGAIHQTRLPNKNQSGRMLAGLSCLLAFQLILFASTGLIWQGLFNPGDLLPLIDRAVIIMSLVLVIWLWAFPNAARRGDAAIILLGLIALAGIVLAGVWWFDQPIATPFVGTWIDRGSDYFALGLAGFGALVLLIRQPSGWGMGLAMLFGLALGHLANLFIFTPNSDYSGAIRLTQMASYPLLLALPGRFPVVAAQGLALRPMPAAPNSSMAVADRRNIPLDIKTLRAVLDVSATGSLESISPILAKVVSHALVADVCLLVTPPDILGNMNVLGGYDLIRERTLPKIALGKDLTPTLGIALQNSQALRLPASSGSVDMVYLGHRLSVQKVGHLMAVPIKMDEHGTVGGIVILSPYTMRTWNDEDQSRLEELADSTAAYLKQFMVLQSAQDELQHVQTALQALKTEKETALAEQQTLLARVQELQAKNAQDESQSDEMRTLKEELRLALEEISYLSSVQGKFIAAEPGLGFSRDDFAEIQAVAEELRQPMASLVGYTDVLLAESHGILGDRQRKIVERIRIANERMTRLLDELIGNLNLEDNHAKQFELKDIDLESVIRTILEETEPLRTPRHINIQKNLEPVPSVYVNPVALHNVLEQLLKYASRVSKPDSHIFLQTHLRSGDGENDYVLFQITDTGRGFTREELPQIFSNLSGIGDGAMNRPVDGQDLYNLKPLVESFGGRILIDSDPGHGATFSLLLPVRSP